MKKLKLLLLLLIFANLFFFSCTGSQNTSDISANTPAAFELVEASIEVEIVEDIPLITYVNIVAVGDNLVHHPIFEASYSNSTYSFHYIFDHIKDYILPADIAFINQETIFGNEELGYSGYPRFSTPAEMGTAVVAAGFNVINFANNHALDRSAAGVMSSIEYLDNYDDVYHLGIHRSQEERNNRNVIFEMENISIGFLAYTFSVNGIAFPAGRNYLVSMIDRDTMRAEVNALRPLVDYLIVSLHWGEEYALSQNRAQRDLAAFLAELQVDLIIGHHPHVLQPMEIITRPDGQPMPVFYSLGNFLSSHARTTKEALLGGIMYVRLAMDSTMENEITLDEVGLIPVITHFDSERRNFGIYPLHEYTDELAALHWRRLMIGGDPDMTVGFFTELAGNMFGASLIMENVFER